MILTIVEVFWIFNLAIKKLRFSTSQVTKKKKNEKQIKDMIINSLMSRFIDRYVADIT